MFAQNMQNVINQMVANNMLHHGYYMNANLFLVDPVEVDNIDDGHGATGALYLIGYSAGDPVYRTTHTLAHHMEGSWPGQYEIHWPPLFPNVWIPECEPLQLDVTIRQTIPPFVPPIQAGGYDDDDDDDDVYNDVSIYDYSNESDEEFNDDEYDIVNMIEEEDELATSMDMLHNLNIQWIHPHHHHIQN